MTDIANLVGDFSTEEGLVLNLGDYSINELAGGSGLLDLVPPFNATELDIRKYSSRASPTSTP